MTNNTTGQERAPEPDMSWFDIAVDKRGNTVILDYAPGWDDHTIEFYWGDTFASDPPKHLPAGAYRWTGFKVGFWGDGDHINVTGGEFVPQNQALSALPHQPATDEGEGRYRRAAPYEFDRYINGQLMAEGVTIEREKTLEDACRVAARIASRGPNGEAPVLVLSTPTTQPPAAETRLRDLLVRCESQLALKIGASPLLREVLAALTQPEPTADCTDCDGTGTEIYGDTPLDCLSCHGEGKSHEK